ncbi:histidine kinase [Agromyces sp. G08B096]|uniref:histidine kinase n=1 Tax=Agromyces sp. G08B096 TaxID=3156399 RepID=A0AAU7W868_9MICO
MHPARRLVERATTAYRRHPELYSAVATVGAGAILVALDLPPLWMSAAWADPAATPDAWRYALLAVAFGVMLLRRRHPIIALSAGTVLFAVDLAMGGTIGMLLVFFDLIYSAAYWGSPRARTVLLWLIVAAVAASAVIPVAVGLPAQLVVLLVLQSFAILTTPYWWGAAVRRSRELAASEAARADDAMRLSAHERERAIRAERARMAQDLHDVIAGNLSAIAIHSEASLSRSPDTARDRAALAAVREASVAGLDQMRSMIVLLRTGDESRAAPPRLAELDDLIAASGLPVTVTGTPPDLPTAADQAAARILVESLRNAGKHHTGGRVELHFDAGPGVHTIVVRSTGGTPARAPGTGHGVPMMRERAEGVGGSLSAGPQGDDWVVTARLPREDG